jgi:hypothetical protein
MLEMRPDCERCGADLPADEPGAFICSMECTFCAACTETLDAFTVNDAPHRSGHAGRMTGRNRCPNCGGELMGRPARVDGLLERYPASTTRKFQS